MEYEDLYPGRQVMVCPVIRGDHTQRHLGWASDMYNCIGTVQTIEKLTEDHVMFRSSKYGHYHWHLQDLVEVPEPPEVNLQGKEEVFDEKELIV